MNDPGQQNGPASPRLAAGAAAGPVLVVEDDADIAEGLRYNLERAAFRVRVAFSGEEGLAASLDALDPPALVILDLLLPGMTGAELCRRLRREPSTRLTPVIILTACDSGRAARAAHDSGADDYFVKPFCVRDLVARVRELLSRAEP